MKVVIKSINRNLRFAGLSGVLLITVFFIVLVTSNNQIYEIEQVKHRDGQVMYISYVDRNELPILNETYGYATKMKKVV